MIEVPVKAILGLVTVPRDRTAGGAWLKRLGITTSKVRGNGGDIETVSLADLPLEVRRAYELQQIEASGLEPGTHDEEAHARFLEATPAMQAIALRKAEYTRGVYEGEAELNKWLERSFKVSSLRFLSAEDGRKAITALKSMKTRARAA